MRDLLGRVAFVLVWPAVAALVLVGVAAWLAYAWVAVPLLRPPRR